MTAKVLLSIVLFAIIASNAFVFAKPDVIPPGQQKKAEDPKGKEKEDIDTASGDSKSTTKVEGSYRIHVVGTGKKCIVKEKDKTKSDTDVAGDYASTEGSIDYFGLPLCEEGDKGVATGTIDASVLAEATAIGPDCLAKVVSAVEDAEIKTHKVHTDVDVEVEAEAAGDALALCEIPTTT